MGVVGRETGVGIELAVLVVAFVLILLLPSDRRDCGRRIPVGSWLCAKALGARLSVGDCGDADTDENGRKAEGAVGPPDIRLCSLFLSLTGVGESSIISTQPEELSPAGVLVFSPSLPRLCLLGFNVLCLSGDVERRDDFELEAEGDAVPDGPAFGGGGGGALVLAVLLTLPMRMRGTRV